MDFNSTLTSPEPILDAPVAPSADLPALGPETVRSASSEPDAANTGPTAPDSAPVSVEPSVPVLDGELPLVFCAHCQTNVDPAGKGLCPVCGRFLPDNTVSVVTGLRSKRLAKIVDAYRVDLIEQLFAERGGRDALDVVSRIAIENYALVCAQHKTIEARLDQDGLFTQTGRRRSAFDMLKGISETIDRLRGELPPPMARTSTHTGIDAMPLSALELARDLLKRLAAGETLTDFERGQLAVLHAAMEGTVLLPPDLPPENIHLPVAGRPLSEGETREERPDPISSDASEPVDDAPPKRRVPHIWESS